MLFVVYSDVNPSSPLSFATLNTGFVLFSMKKLIFSPYLDLRISSVPFMVSICFIAYNLPSAFTEVILTKLAENSVFMIDSSSSRGRNISGLDQLLGVVSFHCIRIIFSISSHPSMYSHPLAFYIWVTSSKMITRHRNRTVGTRLNHTHHIRCHKTRIEKHKRRKLEVLLALTSLCKVPDLLYDFFLFGLTNCRFAFSLNIALLSCRAKNGLLDTSYACYGGGLTSGKKQ